MNYFLLAPELVLVSVAIIIILVGLFLKIEQKRSLGYFSIFALTVALVLTLNTLNVKEVFLGNPIYNTLIVDSFGQFFNLIFLSVAIIVAISSLKYYKDHPNQDEYYSLLLFATAGMMIVALANDLISLYVGLELASLSTYVLAGFNKKDPRSLESAMKYFIIGALSSAIILFGMSFVYGIAGSTNLQVIAEKVAISPIALLAMVFLVAGFGFKMAVVPFHMWAPDAYQGAPSVISALLAAGSKKMGFIAAFRVFVVALVAIKMDWYLAFAILAVITMTLGNIVAIAQKSVKRMLAYSSVAHAGYISIAFVVIAYSTEAAKFATAGGILHAFSHAIMTAGAFIVVAAVGSVHFSSEVKETDDIEDYSGLGKRAPITAFLMAILLISLAGIPPTFGFYSKFVLFLSAIQGGLLWLAIIAVLNSALSVYYYVRVIMYMYWKEPKGERLKESGAYLFALIIAVILTLGLGIYPEPIFSIASRAAEALLFG